MLILFLRKLVEVFCRKLPLQNKVVFDNYSGLGMGDDPKYIAMELLRRRSKLKLYWIVADKKTKVVPGIKTIKLKSLSYIYHVMTAKVIVDNTRSSHHLQKHVGQYYIQTWHATVPLKKAEQDVYNLGRYYIINAVKHAIDTDLMYSNNEFHKYRFEHSYWYDGPVIKCDVPRVSILLNTPFSLREDVYNYFNISNEKGIVLYAPTFRSDYSLDEIMWDYQQILQTFNTTYKRKHVMLIRLHPNIVEKASYIQYSSEIVNASSYPDMIELLAVADFLITDYSSSMFDFGITKKPVFLFCKDLKEYVGNDRNLEFSISELPFPMAESLDDLKNRVENFSTEDYHRELDLFYAKIGYKDSGRGSEVIADIIENHVFGVSNNKER